MEQHKQNRQYFHGSSVSGLQELKPQVSEHGMPLVYLTSNPVVAALYTVRPVEKPFSWYPYSFSGTTPVYTEYYPDALRDIYRGKMGFIYRSRCEVELSLDDPTSVGCALVSRKPVTVDGYTCLADVYEALLEYERAGTLIIKRYETLTEKQRGLFEKMLTEEIQKHKLKETDCDYGRFLQERFADVWENA